MGDREDKHRLSFTTSGSPTVFDLNTQHGQAIPLETKLKRTSSNFTVSTSGSTSTKSTFRRNSHNDDDVSGGGANSISYRGIRAREAAASGNLPVIVLLWSIAATKKPPVSLITPDAQGNNLAHFAALADTPEILGFLFSQQTASWFASEVQLVNAANDRGETPLLRAMTTGKIPVIKALLDANADPFVRDNFGNSIFGHAAKYGQLWTIHYMFDYLMNKYEDEGRVFELLYAKDVDGHGSLEWAADAGDVNILEYLLRKGLDPFAVDKLGRGPLHWAVRSNKVAAARFLVMCGCNPNLKDDKRMSPLDIAAAKLDADLVAALHAKWPKESRISRPPTSSMIKKLEDGVSIAVDVKKGGFLCFFGHFERQSHAIYRGKQPNVLYTVIYTVIILGVWAASIGVPWYAWLLMCSAVGGIYYYLYFQVEPMNDQARRAGGRALFKSFWRRLLSADEKFLGVWLGTYLACLLYVLNSIMYLDKNYDHEVGMDLGALGYSEIQGYASIILVVMLILIIIWLKIVFYDCDPGIVDTRGADFDEVFENSKKMKGAPNSRYYCRTTLVKKPMRSKYCVKLGYVIARFDHHCIWLNTSIGLKNHRSFIVFLLLNCISALILFAYLVTSLNRELSEEDSCSIARDVVSHRYLFPVLLSVVTGIVGVSLFILSMDQLSNMASNITTNEKLNIDRYTYLSDVEGNPKNRFDNGMLHNILEFWKMPGFAVDYSRLYDSLLER